MKHKRILLTLILLDLFSIWMAYAAWRLISDQTALADTVTGEAVASTVQRGLYAVLGLAALLLISTTSTIFLFWWPRKTV